MLAEADPAAFQKQLQGLERRERRENQRIDQAEEPERIKPRTPERDLTATVAKHVLEQSAKGAAAAYNPTADPDYARLAAARDTARSALETALDALRAKFNVRRTDIDNAREDELAKLNG